MNSANDLYLRTGILEREKTTPLESASHMATTKHPHRRRTLSAVLIVLGGVFFFLAPDNAWIGAVLAILGAVIELIAFGLARRSNQGK